MSRKPLKGQITLIGEVLDFELKYKPHLIYHKDWMNQNKYFATLRLPAKVSELDMSSAFAALSRLQRLSLKSLVSVTSEMEVIYEDKTKKVWQ